MYGFFYFVQLPTTTIDARFEEAIGLTSISTALAAVTISGSTQTYADVQFSGDITSLVQFSHLIPVAMSTKLTVDSFDAIATVVESTWTTEGLCHF